MLSPKEIKDSFHARPTSSPKECTRKSKTPKVKERKREKEEEGKRGRGEKGKKYVSVTGIILDLAVLEKSAEYL